MHQVYVAEKPIIQPGWGQARLGHQANLAVLGCPSPFRIPASLITGIQWWARGMEILGEMKYWRLINPPEKTKVLVVKNGSYFHSSTSFKHPLDEMILWLGLPQRTYTYIVSSIFHPHKNETASSRQPRRGKLNNKEIDWLSLSTIQTAWLLNWISGIFMSKNDHLQPLLACVLLRVTEWPFCYHRIMLYWT